MPTTPKFHSGVGGKLTAGAADFAVIDWSFTTTNRLAEITNSLSAGWAEWLPTVSEATGTANCVWDSNNIPDGGTGVGPLDPFRGIDGAADTVDMTLTCGTSGKTYAFKAVIESVAVTNNNQNDAIKFAVNFKATKAVTAPAGTSP